MTNTAPSPSITPPPPFLSPQSEVKNTRKAKQDRQIISENDIESKVLRAKIWKEDQSKDQQKVHNGQHM